jgi:hypothetical protein
LRWAVIGWRVLFPTHKANDFAGGLRHAEKRRVLAGKFHLSISFHLSLLGLAKRINPNARKNINMNIKIKFKITNRNQLRIYSN